MSPQEAWRSHADAPKALKGILEPGPPVPTPLLPTPPDGGLSRGLLLCWDPCSQPPAAGSRHMCHWWALCNSRVCSVVLICL